MAGVIRKAACFGPDPIFPNPGINPTPSQRNARPGDKQIIRSDVVAKPANNDFAIAKSVNLRLGSFAVGDPDDFPKNHQAHLLDGLLAMEHRTQIQVNIVVHFCVGLPVGRDL